MHFTNKNILELLKKTVPRPSRQHIATVLQQEWKLKPVNNSLNYQTYIYNTANELVPAYYTGRYYTISRDWILKTMMRPDNNWHERQYKPAFHAHQVSLPIMSHDEHDELMMSI